MGEELPAVGAEDGELYDRVDGDGNDPLRSVDASLVVQAPGWYLLRSLRFHASMV